MARYFTLLSALVVLIAACGGTAATTTSPPTTSLPSTSSGEQEPLALGERLVGCRGGPFFPATALDDVPAVAAAGAEMEAAMREFLDGEEGRFWPQDGWRVLHETDRTALLVHHDVVGGSISFTDLERRADRWRWAGGSTGGRCVLETQLPDGLGLVDWRLDPGAGRLGPETTSIAILATERGCASGRPMGDRLLGPEVVVTDAQVLVTLAVRPLPGAQNCQGNPEQLVLVELAEPLGDRELVDGLSTGLDLADYLN